MGIYPNWAAGQRLTAASLAAGQSLIVFKASNTDRASTTTLTDDPDLAFSLAANAMYLVEFYLHYAAITGALFTTAWTVPSGASGNRSAHGLASTVADTSSAPAGGGAGSARSGVHGYGTSVSYGNRNSATTQCFALEESMVTTSAAGTCALKWAQSSSNATATRLSSGSWARALRIS